MAYHDVAMKRKLQEVNSPFGPKVLANHDLSKKESEIEDKWP